MKKKNLIAITLMLAMLTACGQTDSSSGTSTGAESSSSSASAETDVTETDSTEAVEDTSEAETQAQTETTETSTEKAAETKAENNDADFTWLNRGVYIVVKNDVPDRSWYVFTDANNGKTANSDTGIGIGFTCEQTKSGITFHFGSRDDNSEMTMSYDENGDICGTMDGNKYVFYYQDNMDPDNFDATKVTGRGDIITDEDPEGSNDAPLDNTILNFIGNYSNGRATMQILPGPEGASINVKWAGSALVSSTWEMGGSYTMSGTDLIITYSDCKKSTTTYSSEGELVSDITEYTDGTGTITIHYDGSLEWVDDVENAGADYTFYYEQ